MSMPWFRYYNESANDDKIEFISQETGWEYVKVLGAWSILECKASASPRRGSLYVTFQERFSETQISKILRFTETDTKKIMFWFTKLEMLEIDEDGGYHLKNWEKRQFESDTSTDRVKKHREKQKKIGGTPGTERFRNAPDTEADTDTDTDIKESVVEKGKTVEILADEKHPSFLPPNLHPREEEILFLQAICKTFDTKIANTGQGQTLLAFRGKYGQETVLDALNYYAMQGVELDTAVRRANGALPTWGQGEKRVFIPPLSRTGVKPSPLDNSLAAIQQFIQEHP